MKKITFLFAFLFAVGLNNSRAQNVNNALSFDGVNDYISAGLPMTSTNDFTLEAWIYPSLLSGTQVPVSYGFDNGSYGDGVSITINGNRLQILFSGITFFSTGYTFPSVNQWYHIAFARSKGTMRAYVNSIQVPNTSIITPNVPTSFRIGSQNGLRFFNGKIDEVRIWNKARNQAEIQSDMHLTGCGNAPGLVAYYPFNQGIAGSNNSNIITADDITSNNNDGNLTNFALSGSTSNWVTGVPGLSNSLTFYKDADNDAYGNKNISVDILGCNPPAGYVMDSTDCNDTNASIHPLAAEFCNGIDENCNGVIDEISGLKTTNITATTAIFNWKPLPGSKAYFIKYRLLDPSAKTLKAGTAASAIALKVFGLRPNSYYAWEIKSYCDGLNTPYSGPVRFKTAAALSAGQQEDESIKATGIGLSVYPNPGNGNMTVSISLSKPQAVSISVSDVAGKEVYASREGMVGGTFTRQVDLSKLNPGTYFLKLTHDGKSEIKKIVVKK